jgi:hypothetical protein
MRHLAFQRDHAVFCMNIDCVWMREDMPHSAPDAVDENFVRDGFFPGKCGSRFGGEPAHSV